MIEYVKTWCKFWKLWFRCRTLTWKLSRQEANNALLRRQIQDKIEYLKQLRAP